MYRSTKNLCMLAVLLITVSTSNLAQTIATQALKPVTMKKMDHSHTPIALPKAAKKPRLSITIAKDVMSGYNLTLKTENYILGAPPVATDMQQLMKSSNQLSKQLVSGHAHLYVNGKKIQRIYGNQVHLPQTLFKQGINSISVTLNDHAHRYWTVNNKKILATIMFNTLGKQKIATIKQNFASFPAS